MRIKFLAASLATLFTHALATAAPAPTPMAPTGPWNVEFADKLCVITRPYAVGDKKLTFGVKAELVGQFYEIMIVRAHGKAAPLVRSEAHIIKSGRAKVGPFFVRTYGTEGGPRISRFRVDPEKYRLTEDDDRLTVDLGKEGAYALPVPALAKALGVLDGCIKDLRKDYQIDQAVLDRVAIEPKKIEAIFGVADYPIEALRIEGQGDVGAVLSIDETGRVSDCIVVEASGVEPLDKATCPLLRKRARYEPARDAQGKKLRAPAYYRLSWQLPDY